MWPPTRRQTAVAVRWEGSASVWRDFWFSACWHGIPSPLTALSLTCFCACSLCCHPDNWQGERRPRLPPQSHGLWTERVWFPGALLSSQLPHRLLPHGRRVLRPWRWQEVGEVLCVIDIKWTWHAEWNINPPNVIIYLCGKEPAESILKGCGRVWKVTGKI